MKRGILLTVIKQLFDLVVALLLLAILSPLLVVLSACLVLDGGPLIFVHERIGYQGKSFKCFKFRTMIVDASECLAHAYGSLRSWRLLGSM